MSNIPLLSVITFLPLVGVAMLLILVRGEVKTDNNSAKQIALLTSVATFLISLGLWTGFDNSTADFQFVEKAEWLPGVGVNYHMGIDGISMLFVLLATLLTPICILSAWDAIKVRVKEYMISFLILETMMIGMFCALDMMLFYVFFEAVLIPMFIIIGVWGGKNRIYAAFKLFLYTLLGSVLMLVAMMAMYWDAGTFDIPTLMTHSFPAEMQTWIWLAFFASFAVKVPMWPVHTWLPDAHVQAPTAGSVILAGVLLKMGGYGFLRFSIPMMPIASADFTPLIYTLSIIAIIYTSLVALVQEDMKKLIAYSSIAHMGFVTIGAFTGNIQGIEGSIFTMLSHGIVSAALFLIVGVIYDRIHTRDIAAYGGLVERMPKYALIFMLFMMASVGLPGTSGFVGEILVLVGIFQVDQWVAALAATGAILGAAYSLYLYRRVVFGTLTKESLKSIMDMNRREVLVFAPLIVLTLFAGVYPQPFLDVMHASVENLVNNYQAALAASDAVNVAAQ